LFVSQSESTDFANMALIPILNIYQMQSYGMVAKKIEHFGHERYIPIN